MELVRVPNFGSVGGDMAVAVFGMPLLSYPQGHEKAFANPDLPAEMLERIFAGMPTAVERGLLGKKRFCCKCRRSMSEAMVENGRLTIYVRLRDLESFRVEVAAPLFRCPFCRQQQVLKDRKLLSEIPEAVAKGLESISLKNR
jgi:hypothetical protein